MDKENSVIPLKIDFVSYPADCGGGANRLDDRNRNVTYKLPPVHNRRTTLD